MSVPQAVPRRSFGDVLAVWITAAVVALAIGLIAPSDARVAWMPVGLGACFLLTFALQLRHGTSSGFIQRVAASVLGAFAVMGFVGIGFGLATLFPA